MAAGTAAATGDEAFLVAASAANLAGWHDAHLRALGFRTEWRDGLWLTPDAVPPIFFHAIAVRPDASAVVLAECLPVHRRASVSDPWADLALSGQGFVLDGDHDWMVRRPSVIDGRPGSPWAATDPGSAALQEATPSGLAIEQVRDADGLADFERTAATGFGSRLGAAFSWHSPPVLLDPRLQLWRGRLEGETVAVSMGFAEAGVLGIYGVTTLPGARRRGYGTAMTRHALEARPGLLAVLQPSAMAERLYGRLGFQRFTTFRAWDRE